MYRIFSAYMEIESESKTDALRIARLNAAAVIDLNNMIIIADYRTMESENNEKG